jgi:hypothetical protein
MGGAGRRWLPSDHLKILLTKLSLSDSCKIMGFRNSMDRQQNPHLSPCCGFCLAKAFRKVAVDGGKAFSLSGDMTLQY